MGAVGTPDGHDEGGRGGEPARGGLRRNDWHAAEHRPLLLTGIVGDGDRFDAMLAQSGNRPAAEAAGAHEYDAARSADTVELTPFPYTNGGRLLRYQRFKFVPFLDYHRILTSRPVRIAFLTAMANRSTATPSFSVTSDVAAPVRHASKWRT